MRTAKIALSLLGLLMPSAGGAVPPPPAPQIAQPAAIDPARLAIAERIARRVLPAGGYRRIMAGLGDRIAAMTSGQALDIPLRAFGEAAGMSAVERSKLGPGTLAQIMAIIDPVFAQRQKIITTTMFDGLAEQMSAFEPEIRQGMAEAYARRFDSTELAEIDAFFATPTGTAYAAEALQIANDPAVADRMQAIMPTILKALPALIAQATAATAKLPPPRKPGDLNPAECAEVGRLLGLPDDSHFGCSKPRKTPRT